jgi:hypothetical protein
MEKQKSFVKEESLLSLEESNKKIKWYSNPIVRKKLLDYVRFREVMLKSNAIDEYCIRGLNIMNESFLDFVFNFYSFYKRDYNIYISTAYYKRIPFFDMNLKFRSTYTNKWFNNEAENWINGYTILLDFDSRGNFMQMKTEVNFILKLLITNKVSFIIIPSGNNFQIHIDNYNYKYTNEDIKIIIENIKNKYKLKTLDLAGAGTLFKVMKTPFSYVNNIGLIPINFKLINEFMEWNYKIIFDSNNIIDNIKLNNYFGYHINYTNNDISIEALKNFLKTNRLF